MVSAPSGAGKTTLVREVLDRFAGLSYSVSHTTRPPRTGEIHGKDYFFTAPESFQALIDTDQMLEWAKVHGNFYGTSRSFVEEQLAKGNSIILDIDVQGGRQIMDRGMDLVSLFIMPPSLEVLEERLSGRGTDSEAVIRTRLANAREEISQKSFYDHVVVNDRLEQAIEDICAIFAGELGAG